MRYNYNDYLNYELPTNWCVEEDDDANLVIYDPNGKGAITISFYSVLEINKTLTEQIGIMAKKFIDQNNINLYAPLIVCGSNEAKITLSGTGMTSDGWFIKMWIIAKQPKIIFATYQSKKKSTELKICDTIMKSFDFN